MDNKTEISLRDGTIVRHRQKGYEGTVEGTTAIKGCFTSGGEPLNVPTTKEPFQYRVAVSGMPMRHIAPLQDLEILDAAEEIDCPRCHRRFCTKPGLTGKAGGRCACSGWICPMCLACRADDAVDGQATSCGDQRKRLMKVRNPRASGGSSRSKA